MILEHCLSTRCRTHESQLLCRRVLEKYILYYDIVRFWKQLWILWVQVCYNLSTSTNANPYESGPFKALGELLAKPPGDAKHLRDSSTVWQRKKSCHWQMVNCHQPVLRQMGCGAFFVKSPGSLEPFCQCFH